MSDVQWTIKGREFVNCNCAYGCPCQFNARPTDGSCRGVLGMAIETGHHGDTKLDGLKLALVVSWPGAIHEGHGEALAIIDEQASPEQRNALLRIVTGEDTEPGATFFQVFAATFDKLHEPVFARIQCDIDVDARRARLLVPDLVETRCEPIVNPVTGEEHRARIDLPHGFEFAVAEIGRGWSTASGAIRLEVADTHTHFARLHMNQSGVIH
jgi:hypothetical protein